MSYFGSHLSDKDDVSGRWRFGWGVGQILVTDDSSTPTTLDLGLVPTVSYREGEREKKKEREKDDKEPDARLEL